MELVPGPDKADNICGKTKVMGMMQRGSTVYTTGYKNPKDHHHFNHTCHEKLKACKCLSYF
jgi:hypothetical protein